MVSSVTFGKISTINGKTVLSGSQSGIDTDSLIKTLTEARALPATKLTTKNATLASQVTALGDFQKLLTTFQTSADLLRNTPIVSSTGKNVFNYRTTSITTSGGVGLADSYVSATANEGAVVQDYTISDITLLAKAKKQQSNTFALSSPNDAVVAIGATAGQFEAAQVTVKGQIITLASGDSLQTVADKFNAVSDSTQIKASILQVSTGQYRLLFTAAKTGLSADFDLTDPGTVSDPNGAFAHVSFSLVQGAQNAKFKVNGIALERESNQVTDAVSGVTINLKQDTTASPALEFNVSVQPDTASVKTAITNFLDSYNNLRLFFSKQTELGDDGLPKTTTDANGNKVLSAVLSNDVGLRSVINNLSTEINRAVAGIANGNLDSLSDIGVTVADYQGDSTNPATRNILQLDDTKLQNALSGSFDQVAKLFQFTATSNISDFQVFNRTNALAVTSFNVSLDPNTSTYTASYQDANNVTKNVTLDATNLTSGGGVSLKGPAGSVLEGLQMVYVGSIPTSGTVKITQGIADRLYNASTNALDATSGIVTNEISALKTQEDRNTTEITRINDAVETYRNQLLDKFALLEKALSSVNTILQTLQAQADARNNSN